MGVLEIRNSFCVLEIRNSFLSYACGESPFQGPSDRRTPPALHCDSRIWREPSGGLKPTAPAHPVRPHVPARLWASRPDAALSESERDGQSRDATGYLAWFQRAGVPAHDRRDTAAKTATKEVAKTDENGCESVCSCCGGQVSLPSDGPEDGRAAAAVKALQREIDLMRDLEHRHIVRVVGWSIGRSCMRASVSACACLRPIRVSHTFPLYL